MLEPCAPEYQIFSASLIYTGKVRAHVGAFGRSLGGPQTVQELAGTLNGMAVSYQAKPAGLKVSLSGRISRMLDPQWWTRNLRRELLRENEAIEHAQGRIRKNGACYVSDHAVRRKAERVKINRITLSNMEVVNEDGIACNLLEVSDASVSNPKLRRAELMVRSRGFEEMATSMGHVGAFLTITAPSRFHRFGANGKPNPKWKGATPKDAQTYLCSNWAKIRAEWKRREIYPYGIRVVEPHHDGCPHWHLLLFVPPEMFGTFSAAAAIKGGVSAADGMVGIAGAYALEESPNEAGAFKHRFTVKTIDPAKGSATGYIAKYICKNIDGLFEDGAEMGLDFASGTKASDSSKRVRAWASTWGIRQFQQIGGPSVTVWRELRRLKVNGQPTHGDEFEGPRAAADKGLWAEFWRHQGGPVIARKKLSLRPMYEEVGTGKYGDQSCRVGGVIGASIKQPGKESTLITRLHTWTVQRSGLAVINAAEAQASHDRSLRKGPNADLYLAYDAMEEAKFERSGEAASTWTSVNNCTDQDKGRTKKMAAGKSRLTNGLSRLRKPLDLG
jgi:hypothetical protein